MILPIVIALSLMLAFYPGRAALSGRMVAAFCGTNCLTYLLVTGDSDLVELKSLQRVASSDNGLFTGHVVTALLLLALSGFMAFYGRRHLAPMNRSNVGITVSPAFAVALLLYATFAGIYVWSKVGWDTVWSYRGYGSIKDLQDIYRLDPIGKLMASTLNFVTLALIGTAIFAWMNRWRYIALLSTVPISIGFLLGLASGSRITAVYMVAAGACLYLTEKKFTATICAVLAIVLLGYSLEARSHNYLGLGYVPEYLEATLANATFILPAIANISMGLLVTSGSIELAIPHAYGVDFKILSIMPTINLIDGFQAVKDLNEQRISFAMPFNAFGEAWAFGIPFYLYLWVVLFFSGYCVNSSLRYGRLWHALLLGSFLIGLIYASQYPLRNSLRFFYVLMLARYMIGWIASRGSRLQRTAHQPRPSPRATLTGRSR